MSPEMLLQQGHNFRMDWWCVGLLMHEMLSARHPFSGPSHYDTLRNMVTKQPNIDSRVSSGAASVIRSLLSDTGLFQRALLRDMGLFQKGYLGMQCIPPPPTFAAHTASRPSPVGPGEG